MHTFFLSNRLGRWLAVLLLAALSSASAWAQSTANYTFATNSTGSLVDMSSGTTPALTTATYHDDDASAVQPIGFTFGFMGTAYTQFSVNSNGQLQFGSTAISGGQATPFTNLALLAPMGGDNAIQATGKVHYMVLPGTNRILVVEWNSLRIPYSSTVGTGSVVQALMEENTGKVEYRYGAVFNNGTSESRSIFFSSGMLAGQIGVVKTFTTTPAYDATVTTAVTTALPNAAIVPVLNSTADGARTVFTFTPPLGTPTAPAMAAGTTGLTTVNLVITDNSGNEGFFTIFRSTDNVTFIPSGTVNTSSVSGTGGTVAYTQTGLTANTLYYFRVTANNEAAGASTNSNTVSATTQPLAPICGIKSVGSGAGADYPTLTAALTAANINGVCGALVLELQASYVSTSETFPLAYTTPAGASATNTVTVRPAAGAAGLSISSAATQTLNINGGRYFILDGRPGGSGATLSGAAQATDLVVANTSITGIAIQLTNDASFNTVQHCQVKGVGTSLSSSPDILFSSTVAGNGNSDNLIRFNNIGDGATLPYCLMYSASTLNSRNTVTDNNLFNYYGASTAAALYLSSAGSGWVASNNSIYQTTARTPTGATNYGLYMGSGNGHSVTGNYIGGSAPLAGGTPHTVTGTAAAYRFVGIQITTSGLANSVQNNIIANISWLSSSGATTTSGVLAGIYVSSGDVTISGNVVGTTAGPISVNISTAGGYSFGISSASTGTVNIVGNTISNLTGVGSAATVASNVAGILVSAGITNTISRNKIYALASGSGVGNLSTGIWLNGGTTNLVTNNLVGDLRASTSTSLVAVSGLLIGAGTNQNVYSNTIYLNATSTGATFGTSGIYLNSATALLDARNNIVVNKSTAAGAGGYTVALRRISGTTGTPPANLINTTNNNLYYAGTPSATNLIYLEGTTTATNPQQTLAGYKALVAPRENASVTEDVPFLSTNGADPTFLHINPAVPTQVESGGTPVAGVTTDYDGDPRNTSTPDIGADEGSFQVLDVNGPVITFAALGNSSATTSRTLTATITDVSGVASGANAPRLYYRKGTTGAYVFVSPSSVSGSAYTFTLDYSLVGGVVNGDAIQYYVAAQDLAATPNVSTSPAGGGGISPPGTTAPGTPGQFTIVTGLAGVYYVGTSASPDPTRT